MPSVDIVINFDIPSHSKDYIHRVGRTARAGRAGKAITFVTQYDVEHIQRIEQVLGEKLVVWPTGRGGDRTTTRACGRGRASCHKGT